MPSASHPHSGISSATTIRLAQSGQALRLFDSLCASVHELLELRAQSERDAARCWQLYRHAKGLPAGPVKQMLEARTLGELECARALVATLSTTLAAKRADIENLAHYDLPSQQREALSSDLRSAEASVERAAEQLKSLVAVAPGAGELARAKERSQTADQMAKPAAAAAAALGTALGDAPVATAEAAAAAAAPASVAALDPAARAELNGLVAEVRELAYAVRKKSPAATAAVGSATTTIAPPATTSREAQLQTRWADWTQRTKAVAHMDPNELTQWVMRQAYIDNSQDMRLYAYKMEFQTSLKAVLRDELQAAREHRSQHARQAGKNEALSVPYARKRIRKDAEVDAQGTWHVRPPEDAGEITDSEELADYIRDLETALTTSNDDMQVAQLELQGMTQRQQQVLNALSNLSKTLHETSMAILRKIGT